MTPSEWGRVAEDGTVYVTDGRRRAHRRAVPRGLARGGAGLLHPAVRRARRRGAPARAAGPGRRALPRRGRPSRSRSLRAQVVEAQRGRRPDRARRPARRPRPGHLAAAAGASRRARREDRAPRRSREGAARRRGREARRGQRLAQRRQPAARSSSTSGRHSPGSTGPPTTQLWHRFSSARTSYTRRRKAHFAEQNEKREGATVVKERLVKEAEALAGSTEWGPTVGATAT